MSTMGQRIKESREQKGIYQSQLAEMIGVKSAGVISNWEKDINKPSADKMVELCQALEISLSYLLDYYGDKNTPPISGEAMKLAKDYDGLDPYGKKQVRTTANLEMQRVAGQKAAGKNDQPDKLAELEQRVRSLEQEDAASITSPA